MRRLLRIGIPSLAVLAAGALALPAVRAAGSSGCQPRSWTDWHVALGQQCLEPSYVCEHMTTAEMLRNPDVAAAYREALAAGQLEDARSVSRMVGRMRAMFSCEPESQMDAGPLASALPPGHPPVEGYRVGGLPPGHPPVDGYSTDRLPPGHPPLGGGRAGALPPGHPPLGGTCPFGGSERGGAPGRAGPLPFTFEPAPTTTL